MQYRKAESGIGLRRRMFCAVLLRYTVIFTSKRLHQMLHFLQVTLFFNSSSGGVTMGHTFMVNHARYVRFLSFTRFKTKFKPSYHGTPKHREGKNNFLQNCLPPSATTATRWCNAAGAALPPPCGVTLGCDLPSRPAIPVRIPLVAAIQSAIGPLLCLATFACRGSSASIRIAARQNLSHGRMAGW